MIILFLKTFEKERGQWSDGWHTDQEMSDQYHMNHLFVYSLSSNLTVDWHQCDLEDVEVTRQSSWGFNYPKQFSIFCEPFWCWVLNLVCMLVQSTSFRCKSPFFKLISQFQESTRQKNICLPYIMWIFFRLDFQLCVMYVTL